MDPKETGDRREEASFQPDGGGTHRTGPGAGRDRRSQEHLEVQAAQSNVTESAFRVGEAMEEMSQIKKLLEAELEPVDQ